MLFEASLAAGLLGILPTAMLPTDALKGGGFRHQSVAHPNQHAEGSASGEAESAHDGSASQHPQWNPFRLLARY